MFLKDATRKTDQQKAFVVLLIVLNFIKIFIGENSSPSASTGMVLLGKDFSYLITSYPLTSNIITFLLLMFNGFLLFFTLRKYKLIELKNYYPCIFYFLFMLYFIYNGQIIPLLISSLIIFFVFSSLLSISEKNYSALHCTRYGIVCGIIASIYPPFLVFFLIIYLIFFINRLFEWRHLLLPIIGLLVPYIYIYSIAFLTDYSLSPDLFLIHLEIFKIQDIFSGQITDVIIFACLFLLYIMFIGKIYSKLTKSNIFTRKKYYTLLIYAIVSLVCLFIFNEKNISVTICIIILTSMASICEIFVKRRIVYNLIFLVLLISIIIDFIQPYFYA